MFFNIQPMSQNDPKIDPKSSQRLPKSTPRRPRCSQDGLLDLHLDAPRPQKHQKNLQKGRVFLIFSVFFRGFRAQMPPDPFQELQNRSKTSPDPLQTSILMIFSSIFHRIWKIFHRFFDSSSTSTHQPHHQNNAFIHQRNC